MPQAFLGLGSNIGNRMKYLQEAVEEIPDLRGVPVADVAVEVSGASELRRAARELRRAGARG